MTENLTHEAIAQLRAELADAKAACVNAFVMGADWARYEIMGATSFPSERDAAAAKAREQYPYVPRAFMGENEQLRAENARLREQVEAEVVVRHACIDALAEAGCSGAGIQEHVGDALSKLRALREQVERTEGALRELSRTFRPSIRGAWWDSHFIAEAIRRLGLWRDPQPATPPAEEASDG